MTKFLSTDSSNYCFSNDIAGNIPWETSIKDSCFDPLLPDLFTNDNQCQNIIIPRMENI